MEDNVVSNMLTKMQIAEGIVSMLPKSTHEKEEFCFSSKALTDHFNNGGTFMDHPVIAKDFIMTDLMKRLDEKKIPYALIRCDNGLTFLTGRNADEEEIHNTVEEIKSRFTTMKLNGVTINPVTEVKKSTLNTMVKDELSRVNTIKELDNATLKALAEELRLKNVVFSSDENGIYFSSKDKDKVSLCYAKVESRFMGINGSFEKDKVNTSISTIEKAKNLITKENEDGTHEPFYVVSRLNPKNRIEVNEKGMAHDLYKDGKVTHTYRYADRTHPDFLAASMVELSSIKEPVLISKETYDAIKDDPDKIEEAMASVMDKPMYENKNDMLRAYNEKIILGALEKRLSIMDKEKKLDIMGERQDFDNLESIADYVCGKELSNAEYNTIMELTESMDEPDTQYIMDRLNETIKLYENVRYLITEHEFSPEELQMSKEDIISNIGEVETIGSREYEIEEVME